MKGLDHSGDSLSNSWAFFVSENVQKMATKGQLILKCLFGIFNSPKKRAKKFDFATMVPHVELFSLVF